MVQSENGTTLQIAETITLDAPIAHVWARTVDLVALPTITRAVTSTVKLGSSAHLALRGLPRRVWTVETLDPPFRFVWTTRLFGVRLIGQYFLGAAGENRTFLVVGMMLEGRGAGVLGRLTHRRLARSVMAEVERFTLACSPAQTDDRELLRGVAGGGRA